MPDLEELEALLFAHAEHAAERAKAKLGGDLCKENLDRFLTDPDCLRYPTALKFSAEGIDANLFAEPFFDKSGDLQTCRLHVHPRFESKQDLLPLFVAYFAAVINYGQVVTPALCERYGAALLGIKEEAFYQRLCEAADTGE